MINLSDARSRANILKILLAKDKLCLEVDLTAIAATTGGYSLSDLEVVVFLY
jgi:ATP-dependent Zn protease